MNKTENIYQKFGLTTDMMDTEDIIRLFDHDKVNCFLPIINLSKKLLITGEGSSRIFPAKNIIYKLLKHSLPVEIITEGASQANEYNLSDFVIFGVSNSGKTNELIHLFKRLNQIKHPALFGLTAHHETLLEELAVKTSILHCGFEKSVAATKSVVEQALFFEFLLSKWMSLPMPDLNQLADKFHKALSVKIENAWINEIVNADLIYFAGRNNGVAEELTLKTNEILRKRSDFLEGTYAIHGIEEVMSANDVMILIDPTEEEEPKFKRYLIDGVGITIIAISSRQTIFPTIIIPEYEDFNTYLQLAAGWNLLTKCGLQLNIDLDKPQRARKIGNEFTTA